MAIVARDYDDLGVDRARDRGRTHRRGSPARRRRRPSTPDDDWVAPAFWDIQINGRWGHSFSSPDLTVEQVAEIVRAQAALGTAQALPDPDHGARRRTCCTACGRSRRPARPIPRVAQDGPGHPPRRARSSRSATATAAPIPPTAIRDPDWDSFEELQRASGGPDRPDDPGPRAAGGPRVHRAGGRRRG